MPQLVANVTGIDLIIGGHSHSFLYSTPPPFPLLNKNISINLTDQAILEVSSRADLCVAHWHGVVAACIVVAAVLPQLLQTSISPMLCGTGRKHCCNYMFQTWRHQHTHSASESC
jgi:hypothetical protein